MDGARWELQGERGRLNWGEYELFEVVGRGGMATVVRARGPEGDGRPRYVALKFLHRELLKDEDAVEQFRLEGRLGMRLHHESIGRTYGLERAEGRLALVMEFVEGHSLHAIHETLLTSPFEKNDAFVIASLGASLCRGLHRLHTMTDDAGAPLNAVHRDVTPQNVIVTLDGQPKLIDFGIAFSTARTIRTATGMIKGKLAYLAPEYLQGRPWDHRIDVWSVGVVLWELLTGRRLFRADTPTRTVSAVLSAQVPRPRELRGEVPARLSKLVLKALERNVESRFPSALALSEALDEFVRVERGRGDSTHVARWMQRLPLDTHSRVSAQEPSSTDKPSEVKRRAPTYPSRGSEGA